MSEDVLTPERILTVAVEVLRRFGPAKMAVVDVARALGVSHGSIYRHFPSKAALLDTIAERWLAEKSAPLSAIAHEDGPVSERLRRWLVQLCSTKRAYALADPELFATYRELASEARDVVKAHLEQLTEQLTWIIRAGIAQGEFSSDDPRVTAQAVFTAMTRFHDPAHVSTWAEPDIEAAFDGVWSLILLGLRHPRD